MIALLLPPPVPPISPVPPPPPEISHRGRAYGIEMGPTFFAVWDLRDPGPPVATFSRDQMGWEAAWQRFRELERRDALPRWRDGAPWWVLVHLAIAVAFWVGLVFLEVLVLVVANRDTDQMSDASTGAIFAALPPVIVGWFSFVQWRASSRARWLALLGILGTALLVSTWVAVAATPPRP